LSFVVTVALICAAIATQRSKEPSLLAVVSAIPGAQLTPSGPLLEISLRVVGISGLSAAKSARASLNGIVGIEELPARGRMRAMVTRGRSGHLNRRSGNQDRAEDGYNCLSHLYLRQSDALVAAIASRGGRLLKVRWGTMLRDCHHTAVVSFHSLLARDKCELAMHN
jgi:hypothetical protein